MKKHTKIYMDFFGYGLDSFIPCEICGNRAQDIHHIFNRGMGGSADKDEIVNLMALCREDHIEYGDKKQHMEFLMEAHNRKLEKFIPVAAPEDFDDENL